MNAKTFLDYFESLYSGIRWATANVGRRLIGVPALLANTIAEGTKQAILAGMPGHEHQASDSRDVCGDSRALFKYRLESDQSWGDRIKGAWTQYEQGGTRQGVLNEVNTWGEITFASWANADLTELDWANFIVTLPQGATDWTGPEQYDSGMLYDDGEMFDVGNANAVDVDHLRRIIRKWKPTRSKGKVEAVLEGFYYDAGPEYDDGSVYAELISWKV
jgi:hypothetical protein